MTFTAFAINSTTTQLVGNEVFWVKEDASILATFAAITIGAVSDSSDAVVVVDGDLMALINSDQAPTDDTGAWAVIDSLLGTQVKPFANGSDIRINTTGQVIGAALDVDETAMHGVKLVEFQTLSNEGVIRAPNDGIFLNGGHSSISNAGTIEGGDSGIYGGSDHVGTNITNSGSITGDYGIQIWGDQTTILNTGEIIGDTHGLFAAGNGTYIRNMGLIDNLDASLMSVALGSEVHFDNHGTIGKGLMAPPGAGGRIVNTGTIDGEGVAIDMDPFDDDGNGMMEIDNSGFILADIRMSGGNDTISSSGEIRGNVFLDIALISGDDLLENTGLIEGQVLARRGNDTISNQGEILGHVDLLDGADTLMNSGFISGNVLAGNDLEGKTDEDHVVNSGRIEGRVELGEANDSYDGRGGYVEAGVFGGAGDDYYVIDDLQTVLHELEDEGHDTVATFVDHKLLVNFEALVQEGIADLRGVGNSLANTMGGNAGDNILKGRAGNDTLFGNDGDDLLRGGAGADNLAGGDDDDRLISGAGNDLLNGDAGDDLLRGGKGKDTLNGGVDDDTLIGGRGADILIGGYGDDVFKFTKASDNNAGSGYDRIDDFARGQDLIDLSALGVTLSIGGTLTGGSRQAITTEVSATHTRLFIDMDRDGSADMRIDVRNTLNMTVDDFIL